MYRALKAEVASYAGSGGGSFPGLEIGLAANCKRLVARFELLGIVSFHFFPLSQYNPYIL